MSYSNTPPSQKGKFSLLYAKGKLKLSAEVDVEQLKAFFQRFSGVLWTALGTGIIASTGASAFYSHQASRDLSPPPDRSTQQELSDR